MQIHYFGVSSFKIITKEATIITDPFDKKTGLTPPRGAADILILSEKENPLYSAVSGISGEPFLVNDPGKYDTKGVTVTGLPVKQDRTYVTAFLIESEDIKILNLSHIKDFSLKADELEALGQIDILIIPVGGGEVMDATTASKIVNDIQPKIVIPSHYPNNKADAFVKEMGGKSEDLDKLLIKKKDLVEEGTKVVVLTPLR